MYFSMLLYSNINYCVANIVKVCFIYDTMERRLEAGTCKNSDARVVAITYMYMYATVLFRS